MPTHEARARGPRTATAGVLHALAPTPGSRSAADLRKDYAAEEIVLTFCDDGAAFDPRERPEPEPFRELADAKLGGLGISLMRMAATTGKA